MSLELVALFVSVVSMVAAVIAVPSIHNQFVKISPIIANSVQKYGVYFLAVTTTATVCTLIIYRQLFYPCPWYEVNSLRDDAARLGMSQPSMTSQIGQRLCDCGAVAEGWDLQAKSEYWTQQYRTAINFWRRSLEANPSKLYRTNANIADASIWIGDYMTAKELYLKSFENNKNIDHYRYGLARALTFSGDYKESISLLSGMSPTFNDGGSTGQTLVYEGIARLGLARALEGGVEKEVQTNEAKSKICEAIAINHNWKDWISSAANGSSNPGNLQKFRDLIAPIADLDCAKIGIRYK